MGLRATDRRVFLSEGFLDQCKATLWRHLAQRGAVVPRTVTYLPVPGRAGRALKLDRQRVIAAALEVAAIISLPGQS